MTELTIVGFQFAENASRELVCHQPSVPRIPPIAAYDGQNFGAFEAGLNPFGTDNRQLMTHTPDTDLNLYTIEDGLVMIGDGFDGVVLTPDGRVIDETRIFATEQCRKLIGQTIEITGVLSTPIFTPVDAAWNNYYHWLTALSKVFLVQNHVSHRARVVIPDYSVRLGGSPLALTYRDSLDLSQLSTVVTTLKPGVYQAPKVHFGWTQPRLPTDLLYIRPITGLFDEIRLEAARHPDGPRKLLVVRGHSSAPRVSSSDQAVVEQAADRFGFTKILFETASFPEQVSTMRSADMIIAPHGAGLINILFGRSDLRVLELNSDLDNNGKLRTCFYQCSELRGQPYMMLNGSQGDFSQQRVATAIERLFAL